MYPLSQFLHQKHPIGSFRYTGVGRAPSQAAQPTARLAALNLGLSPTWLHIYTAPAQPLLERGDVLVNITSLNGETDF